MNYSDSITIFAFLIYGVYQYWLRETEHRHTITRLRKGIELPQQERKPEVYKLWTSGFVAFILLACLLGAIMLSRRIHYGGEFLICLALLFPFSFFIILVMMLFRDIKARRQHH